MTVTTSTQGYQSNPRQTLCYAIIEVKELVEKKPTDNNFKALELLDQVLELLEED